MDALMPAKIALFVCKVVFLPFSSPVEEANAHFTGHQPTQWDTTDSVMHCRRMEMSLWNPDVNRTLTPQACQRASIMVGVGWDMAHLSSKYRFWKAGCPVPIVDTRTGRILDWKLPECPVDSKVICENDISI